MMAVSTRYGTVRAGRRLRAGLVNSLFRKQNMVRRTYGSALSKRAAQAPRRLNDDPRAGLTPIELTMLDKSLKVAG
jgi:hypothetical protein